MFLRKSMQTFTENYSAAVERLKQEIETADAIVIGGVRDYPHLRGCLTAVNDLKNIFPTSEKNMVYKTCIPADFILMRHWRSIGHGGAGILW